MKIFKGNARQAGEDFWVVIAANDEEEARTYLKEHIWEHDAWPRKNHLAAINWELYEVSIDEPKILEYHSRS